MKPIILRMQAFGPYAGEQVIDFRLLEGAGLYLVCGDTGAGKSTIFDAISYALYDERGVLGSQRRSKYADPSTETEVELHFAHQGKVYRILRKPTQEVLKRRGTGTRSVNSYAELTFPDSRVITGTTEVNSAVVEILGLTDRQFKQVIMIVQGKFDEVLHASSADRQAILRNILNTDFYARLQDRIKEDTKQAKEARGTILDQIHTLEAGLQLTGREDMAGTEGLIKSHGLPGKEVLDFVRWTIAEDTASLSALKAQREGHHKALTDAGTMLQLVRNAHEAGGKKIQLTAELEQLSAEEKAASDRLEAARAEAPRAMELRARATVIEHSLPRYEQVEALRAKIALLKRQIADCTGKITRDGQCVDDLNQKIKDAEAEIAQREGDQDLLPEAQHQEDVLCQRGKSLAALADKARNLRGIAEQGKQLQEQAIQAESIYHRLHAAHDEMQSIFLRAQAGLLALGLQEGMACPVCGATHHLSLAVLSDDVPDETSIKAAEEKAEKARRGWQEASRRAGENAGQHAAASRELEEGLADLLPGKGVDDLESVIRHTGDLWRDAHRKAMQLQESCRRLQELRNSLPGLRQDLNAATEALHHDKEQKIQAETELASAVQQESDMQAGLAYPTRQDAVNEHQRLTGEADRIAAGIQAAEQHMADISKRLSVKQAEIASLEEQIRTLPSISMDEAEERERQARSMWEKADEAFNDLNLRLQTNRNSMQRLESLYQSLAAYDAQYAWMNALNQTANGQLTTKKITLETFVQLHFFDRILQRANQRLRHMSDNQYSFVRANRQQGNRDSSLDLDVIDNWNSTQRSVTTLSGGESFQASLALALGFSDEIQAAAGGVQLDTLFIDEGFGTLDESTLNSAIAVLHGLSGGNRQVGIISHVEELQRRIDRKIVVRKDAKRMGSIATIE